LKKKQTFFRAPTLDNLFLVADRDKRKSKKRLQPSKYHRIGVPRFSINPLTPNDPYRGRTAPLTSKVAFYIFIQQI